MNVLVNEAVVAAGVSSSCGCGAFARHGDAGPYALATGLFVLTGILGRLISNTATAILIFPIAAATEMGASARAVLMSVNVAAAAALLTPVATPVNPMVTGPGGYRFGDYAKLGLR